MISVGEGREFSQFNRYETVQADRKNNPHI